MDPLLFESTIDAEIAATQMPEEYKDTTVTILCNDCNTKSVVPFHIMGGKCLQCKSYNSCRVGK